MTKTEYHSAHYRPTRHENIDRSYGRNGVAFVHDIMDGLPAEYDDCDLIYAELPWQRGWTEFYRRAKRPAPGYATFLEAVSRIVTAESRPVVLVTGRHAQSRLPQPDETMPLTLNEHAAIALAYRLPLPQADSIYTLLAELAKDYSEVGDFCCGYGNSGKAFVAAHGRYVLSDLNPQCIGHISATAHTWKPLSVHQE